MATLHLALSSRCNFGTRSLNHKNSQVTYCLRWLYCPKLPSPLTVMFQGSLIFYCRGKELENSLGGHMVFRGDQSSLTEYKGGGGLMTVIER